MQIVRLYDRTREPQHWMQIIRPTEFAAFSTLVDSGAECDVDGVPISVEDASCVIFPTLADAEAFCRERVARIPSLRFDILDARGRTQPPLLTIVDPARAATMEGGSTDLRRSTYAAVALAVAAPLLIWFDWALHDGILVLPTIAGINAALIAARLFFLNNSYRAAERKRRERVASAGAAASDAGSVTPPLPHDR